MAKRSHFNIQIKADAGAEEGTFTGKLSTYGNIDLGGDIVEAGAFDATVATKGDTYPLLWQHYTDTPIGQLKIVGTEGALAIKAQLNLEVEKAREAYALLKAGDIDGLSIGYWPTKYNYDQDGNRHLTEVELFEGSVVTFPMDPEATVTAVKAMKQHKAEAEALDEIIDAVVTEATEKMKSAIKAAISKSKAAEDDDTKEGPAEDDAQQTNDEDEQAKALLQALEKRGARLADMKKKE